MDIVQAPLERILNIAELIEKPSLECTVAVFDDFGLQNGNRILLGGEFGDFCAEEVLERCPGRTAGQ